MNHVVLITNQVPESVTKPVRGLAEVRMGGHGFDTMSRDEVLETAADCSAIINQAELQVDEECGNQCAGCVWPGRRGVRDGRNAGDFSSPD